MEIINIKNLSFAYPEREEKAIDDISLSINAGEFVVVCGQSGSGKTTLLRLLKRELAPSGTKSGRIIYSGKDITELTDRDAARKIGFVMQNPEMQVVTDKVWHELAFGLESLGLDNNTIRIKTAEMASFFGIEKWFDGKTENLSGGQKQLLSLASVMVMQPEILILDEPTSQLDPIAASDFIATLSKINKELGMTIILTEHRLEEVFPIADKVLVLERGKKLIFDTPEEVGKNLRNNQKMLPGLPSSVRIYAGLETEGKCPLTIREGRDFLSENYGNSITETEYREASAEAVPSVVLKNVWQRYERNAPDILKGISVEAYPGQNLAVLGGNGAGKSTFLGIISAQLKAYRGEIRISGKRIEKYRGDELYRNNVAMLPQNPQTVFLKSTLKEDFTEVTNDEGLICKTAEKLGIAELLDRHPYDLSGGQQQRAALCKVLLLSPKILLLDEPTKGIDAYFKQTLAGILEDLKRDGMTIITVTHDVEFAAEYSDRCAMLFCGEIISCDSPQKFFSDNNFYTTAASRISRHMYKNAVLCGDVVRLCKENGARK